MGLAPVSPRNLLPRYAGYEINTLFVSGYGYPEIRAIRVRHDSRGNDDGPVLVLGVVPADESEIYYGTLDEILDGWTQVSTQKGGLAWVRIRLLEASGGEIAPLL